jgi:hypothetical protein
VVISTGNKHAAVFQTLHPKQITARNPELLRGPARELVSILIDTQQLAARRSGDP